MSPGILPLATSPPAINALYGLVVIAHIHPMAFLHAASAMASVILTEVINDPGVLVVVG